MRIDNFSFKRFILGLKSFEYVTYSKNAKEYIQRKKMEKHERNMVMKDLFGENSSSESENEEELNLDESQRGNVDGSPVGGADEEIEVGDIQVSIQDVGKNAEGIIRDQQTSSGHSSTASHVTKESKDVLHKDDDGLIAKKKKVKARLSLKIVCYELKISTKAKVKADRPVRQLMDIFCNQHKLKLDTLSFRCGSTQLSGNEKNGSLEADIIIAMLP